MPNANEHLRQAQHNDAFSERLCSDDGPFDWAVTVSFYAALHYFDYWLRAKKNVNIANEAQKGFHAYRRKLAKNLLSEHLAEAYLMLNNESELARYFATAARPKDELGQPPFQYFNQASSARLRAQMENLKRFFLS